MPGCDRSCHHVSDAGRFQGARHLQQNVELVIHDGWAGRRYHGTGSRLRACAAAAIVALSVGACHATAKPALPTTPATPAPPAPSALLSLISDIDDILAAPVLERSYWG